MNTKGQGMTLETTVTAVLALIALLVIAFMFVGRSHLFKTDAESCTNKGGTCVASADACSGQPAAFTCPEKQVCCMGTCKLRGGTCQSTCSEDKKVLITECDAKQQICCRT